MSLICERETLRSEISAFCKKLVLSQRAVTLCETEATPKQEEFLHRVLAGWKAGNAAAVADS